MPNFSFEGGCVEDMDGSQQLGASMNKSDIASASKRETERLRLATEVSVTFQAEPVTGPGQNISRTGVFFIAEEDVRVKIRLGDREVDGYLVRAENHGAGKTGLAVKFAAGALD